MIQVIGTENCSRCLMTKQILKNKNIEFEYVMFDRIDASLQSYLMEQAKKQGLMNFPLILKDEQLVELKDVIRC
jgi:glutaredoxin